MDVDNTIKSSSNAKEDSWNDVAIKSEPPEIDIIDEKHLPEEQYHLTNSSIEGNPDFSKNKEDTLQLPTLKLHWCSECKKQLETAESLRIHVEDHDLLKKSVTYPPGSTTRRYTCSKCKQVCSTLTRLKNHMLRHNPADPFECKFCKKTFAVKRYLKKHMLIHEKRGAHVCDICFRGFTYLSNLNEHLRKHLEVKPRKCEICGVGFTCNASRDTHMRTTHTGEKPFECDMCKKKFPSHSSVRRHILGNMKSDRHYKCPSCVKGFSTTEGLDTHIQDICLDKTCEYDVLRTKLIIPTALFHQQRKECQTVGRNVEDQSGYPYFCDLCSKFFLKRSYFDAHQNLHLLNRINVCKICGKLFSKRYKLRLHQNSVTKENPYFECDVCKLKFCHKNTLLAHQKTHFHNVSQEINDVHKIGYHQITFKSAPLRTYERKGHMKMQKKEIVSVVKTEPESEIQDKEDTNLVEEQRKHGKLESGSNATNSNSDAVQNKRFFRKENVYACCDCKLKFCHKNTLVAHKRICHLNLKVPSQNITFKNAPLKAYEKKSSIEDEIDCQPTNFQRGVLKTYERRKNLGEKIQSRVKIEPNSEIQDKEDSNCLQEQRLFGKLNERENSVLIPVKEEPRDALDLTESENSFFFPAIKEETSDPLGLIHEAEACSVKVELEE